MSQEKTQLNDGPRTAAELRAALALADSLNAAWLRDAAWAAFAANQKYYMSQEHKARLYRENEV